MRRLLAICATSFLLVVGMASTAAASPSDDTTKTIMGKGRIPVSVQLVAAPSGCGSGALCFWRDNNTSGGSNGPGQLSGRNSNWSAFSHSSCQSGTWNNCASYAYNNGNSCNAIMWDGTGYTYGAAGAFGMARQTAWDLPSVAFNDVASSNSWVVPGSWGTNSTCVGPTFY